MDKCLETELYIMFDQNCCWDCDNACSRDYYGFGNYNPFIIGHLLCFINRQCDIADAYNIYRHFNDNTGEEKHL